jgi:sugar phosphate isomerase/epimerase
MASKMEESIGVPTSLMMDPGDRTDAQAIKLAVNHIRKAGFKTIEVAPGQFRRVAGKNAETFLKDAFGEKDRGDLRDMLKPFRTVTVHGSGIIIHMPGGRREGEEDLWAPYLELMRFARDIGAPLVTFHSLQPPEGGSLNPEEMAHSHIEFGKIAAQYAQEWDLLAGFELATNFQFFLENRIIDRIGSPRFGILLDLGHVALHFPQSVDINASVLQVAEECLDQTWELHAGGVQLTSQGLREHRPLDRHNILDHGKLMDLLVRRNFRGPFIFEIFFQSSKPEQTPASLFENLDICIAAKKEISRRYFGGFSPSPG